MMENSARVLEHASQVSWRRTMLDTQLTPKNDSTHSVRPTYILLGTDTHGADHVWNTVARRVTVINDGVRERVQSLSTDDPSAWMAYVRAERGWARRRYYDDFVQAFTTELEGR
jgi:hypothetical protein